MYQDKTQVAENGMSFSRAATQYWGHLETSLRASWEALVRGVAPLGKDQAITREARLTVKHFTTR